MVLSNYFRPKYLMKWKFPSENSTFPTGNHSTDLWFDINSCTNCRLFYTWIICYTLSVQCVHCTHNSYADWLDACKSSETRYHISFIEWEAHSQFLFYLFSLKFYFSSFRFIYFCLSGHTSTTVFPADAMSTCYYYRNRIAKWNKWKSARVKKKMNFHLKLAVEYGEQNPIVISR